MKLKKAFLSIIFAAAGIYVAAQTPKDSADRVVNLNEVEISAYRNPTTFEKSARVVDIITKEQIKNMNIQSVADAIDYISGVDLRQRGVENIQGDLSIRGGSFDQVVVLLNGVNMTDPQSGHFSMNLPIDLSAVERIEVLEGPGARSYGPNAFSGAINFITGKSDQNQLNASLQGGMFGYGKGTVSATAKTGKLTSFAAVNYSRSDGYKENTDFDQYGVFYQGHLDFNKDNMEFQLGYLDKSFGAFAFYTPAYPNQYEENRTFNSSIKFTKKFSRVKITPIVYWRRNHDRFELFRENPANWYTGHNYHMTDVYGASLNTNINWVAGKTAVGVDFRSENILSNNLGNPMNETVAVPGEDGKYFTKSYDRNNIMLYAEHTYAYNNLTISAGVIANHNTGIDSLTSVCPGFDVSYFITKSLKLYGSINTSLRMPTFTDLFYNTSSAQGTVDLKPEEIVAYELGAKYNSDRLGVQISGFIHDGSNLIDWVKPSGVSGKYIATNIAELQTTGLQTVITYTPLKNDALASFVRTLSADYMYLNQDMATQPDMDSRYIGDYLRHKLVLRLDHNIWGPLFASWTYRYQDRMGWYFDAAKVKQNYTPVGLTDLQITFGKPKYSVFAGASNLFDVDYEDIGNVPQPGFWLRVGASINVGLFK